ncbi:restriction endonuclease subunit S [Vibrio sp. S9_S30]|uniref:restriction endonuclease subunit S n=1 Tax=Vibrio sp. S9_S30 TaxID=2720226 RepID=UPI0016816BD4|nr:restriction endonuclease subunit S [Vibrio sp. S9_S30]MBD1558839.1 restriction endonuclease subunit S [Vibrio sp. S9_S30]
MSDLPKGWAETELGNVTNYGATTKPDLKTIDDECWVLELEDIEKDSSKLLKRLSFSDRAPKSSKNSFVKGDVLYGKLRPYLNKMLIATEDGICTTEIVPLKVPNDLFENRFLFYWLKGKQFSDYVNAVSYGVNMPRLGTKDGKKAPMIVAPLAEQKRIVEKLDEVLAQVDTIKARLDGIPDLLKRFRQSVLASAVSGKLTEEWRLTNSPKKVDNSELAQINAIQRKESVDGRTQKAKTLDDIPGLKLPTTWSWNSIDICSLKITDGTHHSPQSYPEGDFMYVTSKNVREGYLDMNNLTYVTKDTHEEIYSRCDVKFGDVLYVKDGANTGLACVNSIDEPISLLSSVGVIKVADYLTPKYLQHYLNSPIGRKLMLDKMGGTAIKRLTLKKIKESPLSLPPLEEQKEIVRLVDQYFAFADTIEAQVKKAQARVDNLTQSILAKAFRGELVAQDPTDEPADILLERIAEARADAEALAKAAKKAEAAKKRAAKKALNA